MRTSERKSVLTYLRKIMRRLRRVGRRVASLARPKQGTLVYVGLHRGGSFGQIFRRYAACYGFEPNPELFAIVQRKYGRYKNVHIINAAVAEKDGEVQLNVSSNDGASSSLGQFDDEWDGYRSGQVRMVGSMTVRSVNLLDFLRQRGVEYIDDYVSDIQGMDLTVLKTLRPMIDNRQIGAITCEVTKDSRRNLYADLPDNSESGFAELLQGNYELVAVGWGTLEDGRFDVIPDDWWEMDCKWRLRK